MITNYEEYYWAMTNLSTPTSLWFWLHSIKYLTTSPHGTPFNCLTNILEHELCATADKNRSALNFFITWLRISKNNHLNRQKRIISHYGRKRHATIPSAWWTSSDEISLLCFFFCFRVVMNARHFPLVPVLRRCYLYQRSQRRAEIWRAAND